MAWYRFFAVTKSGHFADVHIQECEGEADSRMTAKNLLQQEPGNVDHIEAWDGPRMVCKVARDD